MILVSIIGDFHSSILPIFYEFKEEISKHILICGASKRDRSQLEKVLTAQEYFLSTYRTKKNRILNYEIVSIVAKKDSFKSMKECCEKITSYCKSPKEVFLNTTEGLSSLALILADHFLRLDSKIIVYDRYANTYALHTKKSMFTHKIEKNMGIEDHLKLKGYKLIHYTDKAGLKKRKPFVLKIAKNLSKFKKFANEYTENSRIEGFYNTLVKKMGKSEEKFIKGGVFEEYIYWLIKDNFQVDDIMTGALISFGKNMNNEIDILVMKDNHLHTIECKFTDKFKTSEYLYKSDSIIDYLDDDGKGMILTVGNKKIGTQDLARANHDNITFCSVKRFREDKFLLFFDKWLCRK